MHNWEGVTVMRAASIISPLAFSALVYSVGICCRKRGAKL